MGDQEWADILRTTDTEVKGPTVHGGFILTVSLNQQPDVPWATHFNHGGGIGGDLIFVEGTWLSGDRQVSGAVEDEDQIVGWVRHVDQRVAATNSWYRAIHLPRIEAQQAVKRGHEDVAMISLDRARKAARQAPPPPGA